MAEQYSKKREWQRSNKISDELGDNTSYLISTSTSILDRDFINAAFASSDMPWAKALGSAQLEAMLMHSQTLGLYEVLNRPSKTRELSDRPHGASATYNQIGLARFATDYITTIYLCDVYIEPRYRGRGLAEWLVKCCDEVIGETPALRRLMLHASEETKAFYGKELGVWDTAEERHKVTVMTRRTYPLE